MRKWQRLIANEIEFNRGAQKYFPGKLCFPCGKYDLTQIWSQIYTHASSKFRVRRLACGRPSSLIHATRIVPQCQFLVGLGLEGLENPAFL